MDPRPLVSAAELWAWDCHRVGKLSPFCPPEMPPIDGLRSEPEKRPKYNSQLMIIHDSKSPVCDSWEGCPVSEENRPFLYTHWWHIDTFCY
ncbi:hypothetical protein PMAYCL1PPCAC_13207, partial [Pristionchus mayeri]